MAKASTTLLQYPSLQNDTGFIHAAQVDSQTQFPHSMTLSSFAFPHITIDGLNSNDRSALRKRSQPATFIAATRIVD
jgi:hypothetical protein